LLDLRKRRKGDLFLFFFLLCKRSIEKLISWGAVAGYPDGTFKPGNSTNRAEMAKIVVGDERRMIQCVM